MADTYEKDLGQKSSLTTSDFIRVVGSDNVSYKQSVASVKTALGIDELTAITNGTIQKYSNISGGTLDNLSCRKVGNTVFASARIYGISAPATGTIFVIPSGFRPAIGAIVSGYAVINSVDHPLFVLVSTAGEVKISYSASQTVTQVYFSGSWSVK